MLLLREEQKVGFEHELQRQLEELRARTHLEMDQLKTHTREMYESENRYALVRKYVCEREGREKEHMLLCWEMHVRGYVCISPSIMYSSWMGCLHPYIHTLPHTHMHTHPRMHTLAFDTIFGIHMYWCHWLVPLPLLSTLHSSLPF